MKENQLISMVSELERNGRFDIEKRSLQHGNTTVFEHSLLVTRLSLFVADKFHLKINREALVRGAMLHDYFLYDWHNNYEISMHGFVHPRIALDNALQDFKLNKIEKNIILRHMFPLTPVPPMTKEAWLVCFADKICALKETAQPIFQRYSYFSRFSRQQQ